MKINLTFMMLLALTTLNLSIVSCNGKEDEPDNGSVEPTPSEMSVTYVKKASCPNARMELFAVVNGEIYFAQDKLFAKYTPETDKWTTLSPLSHLGSLMEYDNHLFFNANSNLMIYNQSSDTWSDASEYLGCNPFGDFERGSFYNLGGKLFRYSSSGYRVYLHEYKPQSQSWVEVAQDIYNIPGFSNFNYKNTYNYDDKAYCAGGSIMEFDTNTGMISTKLSLNFTAECACAFDDSRMLCYSDEEYKYGERSIRICIYNPSINEFRSFGFSNNVSYPNYCEIPISTDKIINVGGRIFVGPTNAAFYEMKIKI